MNYTEITELALSFADREDDEVISRIDKFLLMVESRINRKLKVADMSTRSIVDLTTTAPDQEYFQLPDDFGGLRDIELNSPDGPRCTLTYLNPEQMNARASALQTGQSTPKVYYNIIARQIQIFPPQQTGFLEIVYYQRIMPLTPTDPNNWISDETPDAYIFGLLVEISSFTKDADAFGIWKGRFDEAIDELEVDDDKTRWSGTPLTTKVG